MAIGGCALCGCILLEICLLLLNHCLYQQMEQLQGELVECQALAESRLKEIKDLSLEIQELKKQITQLQIDQKKLPDTAIVDSAPYKTLQTQFSIAVQEGGQLRACLDEARQLLATAKQQHLLQLEEIR